jgi:hypothetical protein
MIYCISGVIFMIRGVQLGLKMATTDVVKRLETRAIAAEQMIQMLRSQIHEIRSFSTDERSTCSNEDKEIQALSIENAELKQKIAEQKNLLIAVETKAGILQVSSQAIGKKKIEGDILGISLVWGNGRY